MLPYIMNYRMDPPGYMSSHKLRASVLAYIIKAYWGLSRNIAGFHGNPMKHA